MEAAIAELKAKMEADDVDGMKAANEKLQQAFYPIAQKLYAQQQGEQAGAQQQTQQNASSDKNDDDNVVDADYEVVDD